MQKGRFCLVKGLSLLGKRGAFGLRFGGNCLTLGVILQDKIKRWLGIALIISYLGKAQKSLIYRAGGRESGNFRFSLLYIKDVKAVFVTCSAFTLNFRQAFFLLP